MKQFRISLFLVVCLLTTVALVRPQHRIMQIHSAGGVVYEVNTAQVDSMVFRMERDWEDNCELIFTEYSVWKCTEYEDVEIELLLSPENKACISCAAERTTPINRYLILRYYGEREYCVKKNKIYFKKSSEDFYDADPWAIIYLSENELTIEYRGVLPDIPDIVDKYHFIRQPEPEIYYYYQGSRIYLQEVKDKMFLTFTSYLILEQIQSLVNLEPSLQLFLPPWQELPIGGGSAFFESKNGEPISSAIFDTYKAKDEIVSVTPLYRYDETLHGLMDEFVVKLKPTTSYAQLQELAEKNSCKVGEENKFVKNQFMIHVSKTANLNAIQMSNLFHETGIFEFSEPNFIILNAFQ